MCGGGVGAIGEAKAGERAHDVLEHRAQRRELRRGVELAHGRAQRRGRERRLRHPGGELPKLAALRELALERELAHLERDALHRAAEQGAPEPVLHARATRRDTRKERWFHSSGDARQSR